MSESRKPREFWIDLDLTGHGSNSFRHITTVHSGDPGDVTDSLRHLIERFKVIEVLPESSQSGVEGDVQSTMNGQLFECQSCGVKGKKYYGDEMLKENEALRSRCEKLEKASITFAKETDRVLKNSQGDPDFVESNFKDVRSDFWEVLESLGKLKP